MSAWQVTTLVFGLAFLLFGAFGNLALRPLVSRWWYGR